MSLHPEILDLYELDIRDIGQSGFGAYEVPERSDMELEISNQQKLGKIAASELTSKEDPSKIELREEL